VESYGKIYRNGNYVEALPIANAYVQKIDDVKNVKPNLVNRLFDWTFNNNKWSYIQSFGDPMTVARYMDKYENGFFTETISNFRDCAVNAGVLEMELNSSVDEFLSKNKKFIKNIRNKTVSYNGVQIPVDKALYVYMALNREQALMGLAKSGFAYIGEKKKTERIAGFATDENLSVEDIKQLARDIQVSLENQFTQDEKDFIKIAESLFNDRCKKLKEERDKQYFIGRMRPFNFKKNNK
jgi:hypothetical protein